MSDSTIPDKDSALRKQYPCMNADVCGGGRGAYTCWNCKVRERGGEVRTLHSLHTVDINPGQSGVTLRNGDKWAKAYGEAILLCECAQRGNTGCNIVGKGIVTDIWHGKFRDLPARLIEQEHEESSRVYSGLLFSMRRAYGQDWPETSDVVAMTYKRVIE